MRWLVTGAAGMLGSDVVSVLRDNGCQVTPVTRPDLDLMDDVAVRDAVGGHDVVVNCAAWTAVDEAETNEAAAFEANAVAAANLARASGDAGGRVVHISTDYVFDGRSPDAYDELAAVRPASAYGRTKAAGEWAVRASADDHLIVRTAWLYGANGHCFPKSIARASAQRDHLDVVDDQIGQPTWTVDVADLILRLVSKGAPSGTYHGTSSGRVSWHGFAREVVAVIGRDPAMVQAIPSSELRRPAPRPPFSVLGHRALLRAGVEPIPDWRERWRAAAGAVLAA